MRVFEVAAKQLGFSRAAQDLGVTPAAVSSQIRGLEDQLGVRLFTRTSRTIRLTRAGEMLLTGVTEAFEVLGRTIERVTNIADQRSLSVSTSASFAAKWLVPRLNRFRLLQPGIDVRIDASDRIVDLIGGEAQVAIRFGRGDYPGLVANRLFEEFIFPVCSPRLLGGNRKLHQPDDLRHYTLIHLDWQAQGEAWPDWRMWLLAAGARGVDGTHGIYFSQTDLIIQAALAGQGVALGNTSLVGDDLATGRLMRPFDLSLKAQREFAYYLLVPTRIVDRPMVAAFRDWILAEIADETGDVTGKA